MSTTTAATRNACRRRRRSSIFILMLCQCIGMICGTRLPLEVYELTANANATATATARTTPTVDAVSSSVTEVQHYLLKHNHLEYSINGPTFDNDTFDHGNRNINSSSSSSQQGNQSSEGGSNSNRNPTLKLKSIELNVQPLDRRRSHQILDIINIEHATKFKSINEQQQQQQQQYKQPQHLNGYQNAAANSAASLYLQKLYQHHQLHQLHQQQFQQQHIERHKQIKDNNNNNKQQQIHKVNSGNSVVINGKHVRILYQIGESEDDLPICSPNAVCTKIDLYDIPWIERQCRCPDPNRIMHYHYDLSKSNNNNNDDNNNNNNNKKNNNDNNIDNNSNSYSNSNSHSNSNINSISISDSNSNHSNSTINNSGSHSNSNKNNSNSNSNNNSNRNNRSNNNNNNNKDNKDDTIEIITKHDEQATTGKEEVEKQTHISHAEKMRNYYEQEQLVEHNKHLLVGDYSDKKLESLHFRKLMQNLGAVYEDDLHIQPTDYLGDHEDNDALSTVEKIDDYENNEFPPVPSTSAHMRHSGHMYGHKAKETIFIGGCSSSLGIEDGHTIADKTRHYKLCRSVHKLPMCKHFRDYTWTLTTSNEENAIEQIVHCRCPKNSVTYLTKREPAADGLAKYTYFFACSPLTRIRCQHKQPCKLFTVRKRQEFVDEVNINALCQCPKGHHCPSHHRQSGVIAGESFLEDNIQTYSGYCMAND